MCARPFAVPRPSAPFRCGGAVGVLAPLARVPLTPPPAICRVGREGRALRTRPSQLGEADVITRDNNIIALKVSRNADRDGGA